jgi:predicted ATP-binding protein involved in virulence
MEGFTMKFEKINIPKEQTQETGIEKIDIQQLPRVVAFVGKNGSGKTRILDLIEKYPFTQNTFRLLPKITTTHNF